MLDDFGETLNGTRATSTANPINNEETMYHKALPSHVTDSTSQNWDAGRWVNNDVIRRRFHMGNEWGSQFNSDIFTHGFEDPAYLSFKLEFGDWGYSLFDEDDIRNLQITNKFGNVHLADFDQMPMGLLDLNYQDFDSPDLPLTRFNLQSVYNAYNYLMNRDEDTRAEYIKEFTRGLLQLQKNMPYIFYNVSGIDKLREFQPKTGFRLKDTKITIECYEGIDMKIKTLLELYRKAAYDEVWQRWILPDIYRYFKLIIYVYDKRILRNPLGEYSLD